MKQKPTVYEVRFNGATLMKSDSFKEASKAYDREEEKAVVSGGCVELVSITETTLLSTEEKHEGGRKYASKNG